MKYGIESKKDISSGMILTICFPESELDLKALYTLQAEWPEFLVPFRYRSVNGQVECTYQLGNRSKLQYRFCSREPNEYVKFWNGVFRPLLDCSDWFLKPLSFVLDAGQIYVDRDGKAISYLYVPSNEDCVTYEELKGMALELVEKNPTTDPKLENKVLRAVMQDFQPKMFLNMLKSSAFPQKQEAADVVSAVEALYPKQPVISTPRQPGPAPEDLPVGGPSQREAPLLQGDEDIVINLNTEKGKREKDKPGKKNKASKKPKDKKDSKGLFSWLGGKKETDKKETREYLYGAGAEPPIPKKEVNHGGDPAPIYFPKDEDGNHTELKENGPCLRLIGRAPLPAQIQIFASPGKPFTIGRFDVTVGQRQCDFEFDRHTKEVSRHHAPIGCGSDGAYLIVDQGSTAGTYLDGVSLSQNVPYPLQWGSRVSFGRAGADYTWEE